MDLQHDFLVDVIFQRVRTVNGKQMAQQVLLIDDYMLCEAVNNVRSFEFDQVATTGGAE